MRNLLSTYDLFVITKTHNYEHNYEVLKLRDHPTYAAAQTRGFRHSFYGGD
jgi:hypothetical protein